MQDRGSAADASSVVPVEIDAERLGATNRRVGWSCMAVGVGTGLVIGLWSFDGPMAVPAWIGEYGSTARRMIRLGHIAFMGLGILNILLSRELPVLRLSPRLIRLAAVLMNIGNIALPLTLFAGAVVPPLKYAMSLPASCVFVALLLTAWGLGNRGRM